MKISLKRIIIYGIVYSVYLLIFPSLLLYQFLANTKDISNTYKNEIIYFFEYILPLFILFFVFITRGKKNNKPIEINSESSENKRLIKLNVLGQEREITINNPFRGIFVVGSAGSGKSESIAIPLINEFIRNDYSGIIYDFKYPSLANEVHTSILENEFKTQAYYIDLENPLLSDRINPINPKYLKNNIYTREFALTLVNNLMPESIVKPDFWSRSATDIITAVFIFLRDEYPNFCTLPHAFAMIMGNSENLLKLLQTNQDTAEITQSVFEAMQRGANNQVSGVIGTLQSLITQINTAELMYIFSGNDFDLELNKLENSAILTIGTDPTISKSLSPLCSIIISVASKMMNKPNRKESFIMLDEFPTIYIPNIEQIPNTGRSNKISTILMCQDIAQLYDSYGKSKGDVLFSSCNNHFYGRVSSNVTSELLSKQFGKKDIRYITKGVSTGNLEIFVKSKTKNESIQEREIIKPSEFLHFRVGEFVMILVESKLQKYRAIFKKRERNVIPLDKAESRIDVKLNLQNIREEVKSIFNERL